MVSRAARTATGARSRSANASRRAQEADPPRWRWLILLVLIIVTLLTPVLVGWASEQHTIGRVLVLDVRGDADRSAIAAASAQLAGSVNTAIMLADRPVRACRPSGSPKTPAATDSACPLTGFAHTATITSSEDASAVIGAVYGPTASVERISDDVYMASRIDRVEFGWLHAIITVFVLGTLITGIAVMRQAANPRGRRPYPVAPQYPSTPVTYYRPASGVADRGERPHAGPPSAPAAGDQPSAEPPAVPRRPADPGAERPTTAEDSEVREPQRPPTLTLGRTSDEIRSALDRSGGRAVARSEIDGTGGYVAAGNLVVWVDSCTPGRPIPPGDTVSVELAYQPPPIDTKPDHLRFDRTERG